MAEINNFTEINENFDTIKTLLNSIRAQGILNTSDVDKLLGGINSKLEKINTDEDIDLIKVFLSELKQNLDERHNVLISKFGAIEALFSNLLKNSSESVKSNEIKELFDIVATNLSVFSREVVSQKESLTDITLRLDAIQSDDSQKKDIIKSVSVLKNDIDRISNGFDSIVLSLNDNFKTVIQTVSELDKTASITEFSAQIADIINSSNTILSALQLVDKKQTQLEDSLSILATKEDVTGTKRSLNEIYTLNKQLSDSVDTLVEKNYKLDNLADKIDASVNIIAGLKAVVSETGEKSSLAVVDRLNEIEELIKQATSKDEFEDVKQRLETVIHDIINNCVLSFNTTGSEIKDHVTTEVNKVLELAEVNTTRTLSDIENTRNELKELAGSNSSKLTQLMDASFNKTVEDINSNAEALNSRLKDAQNAIADLCQNNFTDVLETLAGLKIVVSQVDENNVSANNAIFSNITDRLAIFENSLKNSLERQEEFVSASSEKVISEMGEVQNMSSNLDYKLDASIIEINNSKREFEALKSSVNSIIDLDFVNVVKDLRVDLYAIKQDLSTALDASSGELGDKVSNDLFGKYELLISKLDNVEDEVKKVQLSALEDLKGNLDNISSGIIDILSYVSSAQNSSSEILDSKIEDLTKAVNDSHLNYIENVRDIVEVIKVKVENNLEAIQKDTYKTVNSLGAVIEANTQALKDDIRNSYDKLIEVQSNFDEIKDVLNINNITNSTNIENILSSAESLKGDFEAKLSALKNTLLDKVSDFKKEFSCENIDKLSELKFNSENLYSKSIQNSQEIKAELKQNIETIADALKSDVINLAEQLAKTSSKLEIDNRDTLDFIKNDFTRGLNSSVDEINSSVAETMGQLDSRISDVTAGFEKLDVSVNNLSKETTNALASTLAKILDNFVSVKSVMNNLNEQSSEAFKASADDIKRDFAGLKEEFKSADTAIDEDLERQINIIESNFQALNSLISSLMEENKSAFSDKISSEFEMISNRMGLSVTQKLEGYKADIEAAFDKFGRTTDLQAEFIKDKALELNKVLEETLEKQNSAAAIQLEEISSKLKAILNESIEVSAADYEALRQSLDSYSSGIEKNNREFVEEIKAQLDDVTKFVDSGLSIQAQEVNTSFEQINSGMHKITTTARDLNSEITSRVDALNEELNKLKEDNKSNIDDAALKLITKLESIISDFRENNENILKSDLNEVLTSITKASEQSQNTVLVQTKSILEELVGIQGKSIEQYNSLKETLKNEIQPDLTALGDRIHSLFEENSLNFVTQLSNTNTGICDELKANAIELKAAFETLNERLDKDELSQMNVYQAQVKELSGTFNSLINEAKEVTKTEVATISATLIENSKSVMEEVNQSIEDKITTLLATNADISAGELQSIEAFATQILEQIEVSKQNTITCKDMISKLIKEEIKLITKNIENETDVISGDIIEQFDILKDTQKDDLTQFTSQIEGSVAGYIVDSVNDLKSYLDIKTDSSVLNEKVDNLRNELSSTADTITGNISKLVELSVFGDAIADLKSANEVLVNSMAEKLNEQIEDFIKINVTQKLGDKLNLFDKKFVDTIVEKYEEVKLISSKYNDSFEKISNEVQNILSDFESNRNDIEGKLENTLKSVNSSIDSLKTDFADLKAQILNKSFDEAFQASLNNQIQGIEELVQQQTGYLEDISELCCNNLPEISEIGVIVKHGIQQSISELQAKVDSQNLDIEMSLNNLKTDIITQFLNVFNQISFVTEQEEILEFIQEKHSELITILSHIVTTSAGIENVKDNLAIVENKMDSIKEDVDLLNEKITAIMSSEGDVEYVYSLQDLESDIANLRLVLNEMKENLNSKEDNEEFNKRFNDLAEDIVSISTRTNKLILASDESNKSLQDNLQDFKLVINDLDERTRNFAREAGIERIDNKLGAINTMIQNGAKTNQIFNQVFEYLAEWVDKAGAQITTITDKVETLDDISQIKVMLEDMKEKAQDDTEGNELVEALGNVFDKQAKRISSLESKLDRIIVDNTINNRSQKLDVTPFEDTLNRFLVAIDDKLVSQQRKINSLEDKLEEVMSMIDNKDTAQLTKKVGGMDRQIAKLNKSIEKIASHVVEK